FYFLRFIDENQELDLFFSFGAVLICLFIRPVITGYGMFAGWLTLLLMQKNYADRWRMAVVFCAVAGIVSLLFFLVYGISLTTAFMPRPWEILQPKSYPNLHHLVVHPYFGDPNFVTLTLKQFRGALETLA